MLLYVLLIIIENCVVPLAIEKANELRVGIVDNLTHIDILAFVKDNAMPALYIHEDAVVSTAPLSYTPPPYVIAVSVP